LENPPALSNRDRLSSAGRTQLLENGFDVRFHGSDRHSQLRGNSLVAEPEHHLSQDISFPCRQRLLLHPVGNATGDPRPQGQTTGVHRPQSGDQVTTPRRVLHVEHTASMTAGLRLLNAQMILIAWGIGVPPAALPVVFTS